jgi:gamma-glutamyltranspeptidase/glutathione hydrolase
MVSSAHPIATDVGLAILAEGGNAFDAAVAIAATLGVVEPMMSGMGGYGTILVYSAEEDGVLFLNSSGRIPRAVDTDAYRAPTPGYMQNRRGAKAVSTPGNVNAWEAMSSRFGRLPWARLLEPAAAVAEKGHALDGRTARFVEAAFESFPPHAQAVYGRDGSPLREGDLLVQEDLARSLRAVASGGADVFHGGGLGESVDRTMRESGGFLGLADLRDNEAEWWDPIEIDYRGHTVVTASPPANSFPALVRLGLMSRFEVETMGHNSADYLHTYAEITKHEFWTRLRWAGDPELAPPPLETLLSEAYWAGIASTVDPTSATDFVPPGVVTTPGLHTTHFVVADAEGNVVSATQTLGNLFGSRIMPEGTGIWLNNSLAYSTFEPAGNPMGAHPGRRKLSGDVPLFVMRDGKPWIAVGTPGGHTIAQAIPQVVMNVLDFGMDIQEPNEIGLEAGIEPWVLAELEHRGHLVRSVGAIGNAHGLTITWGGGRPVAFTGAADPRGSGAARGR